GETVLDFVRFGTDPPVVWHNPYADRFTSDMDDIAKAAILESMYRSVTEDRPPAYGADNARRDQELCIAVRESALRGNAWVRLPILEPTQIEEDIHAEFERRYGHHPLEDLEAQLDLHYDRTSVMWTVAGWL
ncbi:MAG: hypothetical protein ACE5O2_11750, partial [Armatimonadota bacterium]